MDYDIADRTIECPGKLENTFQRTFPIGTDARDAARLLDYRFDDYDQSAIPTRCLWKASGAIASSHTLSSGLSHTPVDLSPFTAQRRRSRLFKVVVRMENDHWLDGTASSHSNAPGRSLTRGFIARPDRRIRGSTASFPRNRFLQRYHGRTQTSL